MRINIREFMKAAGYFSCAGEHVSWSVFRDRFRAYVAAQGGDPKVWTKRRIQRLLGRVARPVGRGPGSKSIVCNVSDRFRAPRRWVAAPNGTVHLQKPKP